MKLKEKLAQDLAREEVHPASDINRAWFEVGYLSGFDKAKKMASEFYYLNSIDDNDSGAFADLGEEEVE